MGNMNRRDIGRAKLLLHYVSEYKIIKDRLDILEGNIEYKRDPKNTLLELINKLYYSLPSIQDIFTDYKTLFRKNDVEIIELFDEINKGEIKHILKIKQYDSLSDSIFGIFDEKLKTLKLKGDILEFSDKRSDLSNISTIRTLCTTMFKFLINEDSEHKREFYNFLSEKNQSKVEEFAEFSYIDKELADIIKENYFNLLDYFLNGYVYFL